MRVNCYLVYRLLPGVFCTLTKKYLNHKLEYSSIPVWPTVSTVSLGTSRVLRDQIQIKLTLFLHCVCVCACSRRISLIIPIYFLESWHIVVLIIVQKQKKTDAFLFPDLIWKLNNLFLKKQTNKQTKKNYLAKDKLFC